jgi:ABC-2 type transport system ATP-binding protein
MPEISLAPPYEGPPKGFQRLAPVSRGRGAIVAEPVIDVRGLTKHYADIKAVDGITFEVRRAEMFSLLGPNGAGKTTTVEILEGLRDPTSGEARVLGVDVRTGYRTIRDRVGVLPQDFEPFDRLRPREAVAYWARLFDRTMTDTEIAELIQTVGLADRADTLSMNLSGGEKRRLGIAMSLVGRPELVFLDEPTTGLDPGARRELWSLIRHLKQEGTTILLTTHYLDEAEQLADNVAIMNHGKIVARGSPASLIGQLGGGSMIVLAGAGADGLKAVTERGVAADLNGSDVLVHVPAASDMRRMLEKLASIDLPLTEIYTKRASLEDVFLKVVGARMQEGELAA